MACRSPARGEEAKRKVIGKFYTEPQFNHVMPIQLEFEWTPSLFDCYDLWIICLCFQFLFKYVLLRTLLKQVMV